MNEPCVCVDASLECPDCTGCEYCCNCGLVYKKPIILEEFNVGDLVNHHDPIFCKIHGTGRIVAKMPHGTCPDHVKGSWYRVEWERNDNYRGSPFNCRVLRGI